MMQWCHDASTTECLKGVAAWGEEVEAKQATDWALRCLTDQRPDVSFSAEEMFSENQW